MLTNQQIEDYANYDFSEENLDEWNGFLKGAHWANHQNSIEIAAKDAEIAAKDAEIAKLLAILSDIKTAVDGLDAEMPSSIYRVLRITLDRYK